MEQLYIRTSCGIFWHFSNPATIKVVNTSNSTGLALLWFLFLVPHSKRTPLLKTSTVNSTRQYLLLKRLEPRGLPLLLVDGLHQHTLVLELVTLAAKIAVPSQNRRTHEPSATRVRASCGRYQ